MASDSYMQGHVVVRTLPGDVVLNLSMDDTLGQTVAMLKRGIARLIGMDAWSFHLLAHKRVLGRSESLHEACLSCSEILLVTCPACIEEELESISNNEKFYDCLLGVRIRRILGVSTFFGHVEDISVGSTSRELLYLVRYSDGDVEHMNTEQVEEMLFTEGAMHFEEFCRFEKHADPLM
eukprot:6275949-Karenia_brevis.AAC.1